MSTPADRIPPKKKKRDFSELLFVPMAQDASKIVLPEEPAAPKPDVLRQGAPFKTRRTVLGAENYEQGPGKVLELATGLPAANKIVDPSDPKSSKAVENSLMLALAGTLIPGPEGKVVGEGLEFAGKQVGRQLERRGEGGFFSRIEKAIAEAPQEKAPGGQWIGMLAKAKSGMSKAEGDWVGLENWLKENAGKSLNKAEVLDQFNRSKIQIKEKVLGGKPNKAIEFQPLYEPVYKLDTRPGSTTAHETAEGVEIDNIYHAIQGKNDWVPLYSVDAPQGNFQILAKNTNTTPLYAIKTLDGHISTPYNTLHEAKIQLQNTYERGFSSGRPKWGQYTQEGGENYREILLSSDPPVKRKYNEIIDKMRKLEEGKRTVLEASDVYRSPEYQKLAKEREDLILAQGEGGISKFEFPASRSHFDVDNLISHIRLKDRVGPGGEKVLFVEEIQSDWQRLGRKHGFGREDAEKRMEDIQTKVNALNKELDAIPVGSKSTEAINKRVNQIDKEKNKLSKQYSDLSAPGNRVPDMPFKRQEDWVGLSLKRVIDEAVAGGYDRVAFPTGEQVAEKMGVLQQVSKLEWFHDEGLLTAFDKYGNQVIAQVMAKDEIADRVGKEVAEKLLKQPHKQTSRVSAMGSKMPGQPYQELSGTNLKVGGEHHKSLYDEMIPNWVKDYARKQKIDLQMEPVKVGIEELTDDYQVFNVITGEEKAGPFRTSQAAEDYLKSLPEDQQGRYDFAKTKITDQQSFKITPQLKTKVSRLGQPLLGAAPIAPLMAADALKQKDNKKKKDPISRLFE